MSARDDGGPAFPVVHEVEPEPGFTRAWSICKGLTLRDYFAAKAMQAAITGCASRGEVYNYNECALLAYEQADAMLKARDA